MIIFFIFILFIHATERDIYDIIKNQPKLEPKSGREFVVGVYLHKPDNVDISLLYDTLPMMTQAGLEMTCLVPRQHNNGSLVLSGIEPEPKPKDKTLTKEEFFTEAFTKRRTCFEQKKEYWSYEICQKEINQFHGSGRSPLFSLGTLDGFLEDKSTHKKLVLDLGKKWPLTGASFGYTVYLNGKDKRQALIGWFCSTKNSIGNIQEPRTHKYYIEVYWSKLCEYEGVKEVPERDPSDLASYLSDLDNECIKTSQGWWIYELCYGKHVRQYHEERTRNKKTSKVDTKITVDYTLGKAKLPKKLDLQSFTGKKTSNFVEEQYDQGMICDITGEPRMTTVRYKCMIDSKHVTLKPPEEVSSCIYAMDVAVPALCEHPEFKTHHIPASEIVCYPKGMDQPLPKEEKDEDDGAPLSSVQTSGSDMTSLLGDLLSGGELQNLMRTAGVVTMNIDVSPEELDDLMTDPTRLNELIGEAAGHLDMEMIEGESSIPVPEKPSDSSDDKSEVSADKEEL